MLLLKEVHEEEEKEDEDIRVAAQLYQEIRCLYAVRTSVQSNQSASRNRITLLYLLPYFPVLESRSFQMLNSLLGRQASPSDALLYNIEEVVHALCFPEWRVSFSPSSKLKLDSHVDSC
jgi:hypothetical protein